MTHQNSYTSTGFYRKLILRSMLCVPGMLIGFALCFTIVLIPIGVPVMWLSCLPLIKALKSQPLPVTTVEPDTIIEAEFKWGVPTREQRIKELFE